MKNYWTISRWWMYATECIKLSLINYDNDPPIRDVYIDVTFIVAMTSQQCNMKNQT